MVAGASGTLCHRIAAVFALLASFVAQAAARPDCTKDLDELLSDLKAYGAYVRDDRIDFARLDAAYRPRFAAAGSKAALLPVLEAFMAELHDFHAFVGSNTSASPRLVPSGTDLVGQWRGERAFVEQARAASLAWEAGVRAGDEILALGGVPIREAARRRFGVLPPGARGWDWALDAALAGRWDAPRVLRLRRNGAEREVSLPTARRVSHAPPLAVSKRPGGIVVLRPADSLGEDALVAAFDAAVPELRAARGIVLDLRDTPSGGNTAVARGIMGPFLAKRLPYQRHAVEERATGTVRDWVEYATPRGRTPVRAPLVVLVDRWTGSMGEGIAIGLHAMDRAKVVGTRMAGLRGAVDSVTLPVSGLRAFFPTERVFLPDGTPRHVWLPPYHVEPGEGDPWMATAERLLPH